MLEGFIQFLARFLKWDNTPIHPDPSDTYFSHTMEPEKPTFDVPTTMFPMPPETPKTTSSDAVPLTAAEHLYEIAKDSIGQDMSPRDVAPDSLGCAESLNGVYFKAFGQLIAGGFGLTSTNALWKSLMTDMRFKEIDVPQLGCIVINPTGTSTKGAAHGHCGIWGKFDVMSNDSNSGLWQDNYSQQAWHNVFEKKLGFVSYYFLPV